MGQLPTILPRQAGSVGGALPARVKRHTCSDVEENSLVFALHPDVEAIDRHFALSLLVGDECPAAVGWDQGQDGITCVAGLIREIEARIDLPKHATREDAEDNMRSLGLAIGSRDRSWLDGIETERAILIGCRTAKAHEPGVRPRTIVGRMGVTALRVCLPYLDHGVVDRQAIAIKHATFDTDLRTRAIRGHEIGARCFLPVVGILALLRPPFTAAVRREAVREKRTDGL